MTFTEEVKLLPCPFCGGEAIFRYFPAPYDFQNDDQLVTIRVDCSKCHVSTPKELEMRFHFAKNGQMPFLKDERKDIAVIWNRRWGRMNENKTVFYEDDKTYSGGGTSNYICRGCGSLVGTWAKGLKPDEQFHFCPWCGRENEGWTGGLPTCGGAE